MSQSFFASCPKGLEGLLAQELEGFGATLGKPQVAGVTFSGPLEVAYRACLWSRLANRVLLVLAKVPAADSKALYEGVKQIDWSEHLNADISFAVDFNGTNSQLRHTRFGAVLVKDALVDQFRERFGERPNVDAKNPDLRINVFLHRDEAQIALDLSGASLHQRGYRLDVGKAPLKENLAAAILLRAGWPELAQQGYALIDPLCGSGTLLLEGALMAADIAPGLLRNKFGFERWLGHVPALWKRLRSEAVEHRAEGLARSPLWLRGFDLDKRIVAQARGNIQRAGLESWIEINQAALADFAPIVPEGMPVLLLTNPPYGERLGEDAELVELYRVLGQKARTYCAGGQLAVFTGNAPLVKQMRLRAEKQYAFFNGALPCKLFLYGVAAERKAPGPVAEVAAAQQHALTPGAQMFANRLAKNLKQLRRWARKNEIECYRVYDADMPEYAVAIDLYGDWVHVQEYRAPKSIDEEKAKERLYDVLAALPQVLEVAPERIAVKQRRRQIGKGQYERQSARGDLIEVREHGCRLLVNLFDYLDTGLFLDHRPMRQRIQQEAAGKRVLNLFCYTGAATVHAAVGGASETVSVDLSNTYLEWARQNLALNGFEQGHRLVRSDCLEWLQGNRKPFDLIFMDPPTFSNSKKLKGVMDIQADHVALIDAAMASLCPDGVLYFSNNFTKFKLDEGLATRYAVEEISASTLDPDFKRNQKIHRCWMVRHRRG